MNGFKRTINVRKLFVSGVTVCERCRDLRHCKLGQYWAIKSMLRVFKLAYGLRVNFLKSKIVVLYLGILKLGRPRPAEGLSKINLRDSPGRAHVYGGHVKESLYWPWEYRWSVTSLISGEWLRTCLGGKNPGHENPYKYIPP